MSPACLQLFQTYGGSHLGYDYPGHRGFHSPRREKREKEAAREKYPDVQLTPDKQPITTHLSVNKNQSEYAEGGRVTH